MHEDILGSSPKDIISPFKRYLNKLSLIVTVTTKDRNIQWNE